MFLPTELLLSYPYAARRAGMSREGRRGGGLCTRGNTVEYIELMSESPKRNKNQAKSHHVNSAHF